MLSFWSYVLQAPRRGRNVDRYYRQKDPLSGKKNYGSHEKSVVPSSVPFSDCNDRANHPLNNFTAAVVFSLLGHVWVAGFIFVFVKYKCWESLWSQRKPDGSRGVLYSLFSFALFGKSKVRTQRPPNSGGSRGRALD